MEGSAGVGSVGSAMEGTGLGDFIPEVELTFMVVWQRRWTVQRVTA